MKHQSRCPYGRSFSYEPFQEQSPNYGYYNSASFFIEINAKNDTRRMEHQSNGSMGPRMYRRTFTGNVHLNTSLSIKMGIMRLRHPSPSTGLPRSHILS